MTVDFTKILKRAWEITWRYKFLWIFGFLAGLGFGGGGYGGGGNGNGGYGGGASEFSAIVMAVILLVILVLLVIAIVFAILSVIARGALIGGVQQAEEEGDTGFKKAWRVGTSKFWTLLGISILTALPIIALIIAGVVILAGLFVALSISHVDKPAAFILPLIVIGLPTGCLAVIGGIILSLIGLYADRACVIENKGWIDAFKRGGAVLRANVANTIVFGLLLFVIRALIGGILAVVGFGMIMPGLIMVISKRAVGPGIAAMACLGIPLFLVAIVVSSALKTFSSATWTLAYREMTMPQLPEPVVAEPPSDPAATKALAEEEPVEAAE